MADFETNTMPGVHILISLIEIWTPKDKKKPNGDREGDTMYIAEVEEIEIEDSFKKLIGTASVRFPRGTVIRKTITEQTNEEAEDFKKITASKATSGVIETTRTQTFVAAPSTFSTDQRIKIYLGYTTDHKIADSAKTNSTGKNIFNDTATLNDYKKSLHCMFDGYITKISIDTPIELECENLASVLKTITCPKTKLKKCAVKNFLGDQPGSRNLLKNTGLILHPDTAAMNFDLGGVDINPDLTVADVLIEWSKFGLFCYVSDYNGEPAIQIGRAYFSNPGKDSLLNATTTPTPVEIHFNYHVANNGLGLTSTDKEFLAVQATGIDSEDKFIKITVIPNPKYDSSKPNSKNNPKYRYVNETKLSKKALKAGKRYVSSAPADSVDLKPYTKIAFVSKKIPTDMERLIQEAAEYLEGYNLTGIEGTLTLFGDLHLKTAQQVKLVDMRFPGKNGIYLVEEVTTTFGTDGYRQKITLPYCVVRNGNENMSSK